MSLQIPIHYVLGREHLRRVCLSRARSAVPIMTLIGVHGLGWLRFDGYLTANCDDWFRIWQAGELTAIHMTCIAWLVPDTYPLSIYNSLCNLYILPGLFADSTGLLHGLSLGLLYPFGLSDGKSLSKWFCIHQRFHRTHVFVMWYLTSLTTIWPFGRHTLYSSLITWQDDRV